MLLLDLHRPLVTCPVSNQWKCLCDGCSHYSCSQEAAFADKWRNHEFHVEFTRRRWTPCL